MCDLKFKCITFSITYIDPKIKGNNDTYHNHFKMIRFSTHFIDFKTIMNSTLQLIDDPE